MAERPESDSTTSKGGNLKKKKKRKVVEATITDMNDIYDTTSLLSSSYSESILSENMQISDLIHSSTTEPYTVTNNGKQDMNAFNNQSDNEQYVITCEGNEMDDQSYGDNEQLISKILENSGDIGYADKSLVDNKEDKEQIILKFGNKDERLLKSDESSFPTQDLVADTVNRMLNTTDIKYLPDYSNKCLSEQLQRLNITTDESSENNSENDMLYDEAINLSLASQIDTLLLPDVNTLLENITSLTQIPTVSFKTDNFREIKDYDSVIELDSSDDTDLLGEGDISNNIRGAVLHHVHSEPFEDSVVWDKSAEHSSALDMEDEDIYEVGSLNSKYVQLLDFDQVSSQAVSDTLALVTQISITDSMLQFNSEIDVEEPSPDIEKYIPKFTPPPKGNTAGDLSADDLKKVILANAKMKDEVEESKRLLHIAFNEQQEELCLLRMEHEKMKKDFRTRELENEKKIQELSYENNLLKKQLKYVIAEENDDQHEETVKESRGVDGLLLTSDDNIAGISELMTYPDGNKEENQTLEGKLVQMAEMHGDVLDLQENLQRQIIAKNNQISMMKDQLVELRGPLPDWLSCFSSSHLPLGCNIQQAKSSLPDGTVDGSCESLESLYTPQTKLIHIWIPSVFKKSKAPEIHHIYQVYIRIGSEEWNIYRRYSQFDKLHHEVCKSYPSLKNAIFPEKKLMKFDAKLVESRRLQFQDYLRTLINTLITNNSILASEASRKQLIDLLPFFGETFGSDFATCGRTSKAKTADGAPSIYNGL